MKKTNTKNLYIMLGVVAVAVVGAALFFGAGEQFQGKLSLRPASSQPVYDTVARDPIKMSEAAIKLTPINYYFTVAPVSKNYPFDGDIFINFELPLDTKATRATLSIGGKQISSGNITTTDVTPYRNILKNRGKYPGTSNIAIGGVYDSSYLHSILPYGKLAIPTQIEVELCDSSDVCKKTVYADAIPSMIEFTE